MTYTLEILYGLCIALPLLLVVSTWMARLCGLERMSDLLACLGSGYCTVGLVVCGVLLIVAPNWRRH